MKLTVLFTLLVTSLSAQYDSIPIGKVVYLHEAQTQGDVQNNGYATLLFNAAQSLYIHKNSPKQDSFLNSPDFVSASISGDKEGFPIYKIHASRKLFFKVACPRISKNHCIVSDTFGTIEWMLHPEHKRFGHYDCRRATGNFRGRDYEVWYTLDIPISTGPFKLGGLPGLILEARSLDGMVNFLFSSLEISNTIPGILKIPSGNNLGISYAAFVEEKLKFDKQLVDGFKAKGIVMTITPMETIELNMDN